jgi:uncharacterized protein involved in exopolysaccharide biosynthesis
MEIPLAACSSSLGDVVLPVWRRLWVVIGVALTVVGASMGFTLAQTPVHQSNLELLVGPKKGGTPENLGSEVPGLQQLMPTTTRA